MSDKEHDQVDSVPEKKKTKKRKFSRLLVSVDTTKAGDPNKEALRPCMRKLGLKEVEFGVKAKNCDIHWLAFSYEFEEGQHGLYNKFPGTGGVCGKMSLSRSLDAMHQLFPDEYDFYPRTWYLPAQFNEFSTDVKNLQKGRRRRRWKPTYIVKPDSGSMGEGIFLIRDPNEYRNFSNRCHVVQEYMSDVYLIDNLKFDFRIYAVLKSIEPLELYICKEGLARFSTVPYKKPNIKNLQESFMHLTNYSLNKRSSNFDRSENEDEGSKRTVTSVMKRLEQDSHDSEAVWDSIERVVCKTVLAMIPEVKIEYRAVVPPGKKGPSCFQILGLDILLLDDLTPILLEVNSSPSLLIDSEQEVSPGVMEHLRSPKDEEIKLPLITDTLALVIPEHRLKYCLERRRRLMGRHKVPGKNPLSDDEQDEVDPEADLVTMVTQMNTEEDEGQGQNEQEVDVRDEEQSKDTDIADYESNDLENKSTENEEAPKVQQQTDDRLMDNDDDDDENEYQIDSCLKQIYPEVYEDEYERLRVFERVADLFMLGQGVRGSSGITASGFRTFTRKCQLEAKGMTNPDIDILYIELKRRWDMISSDTVPGLCFKGFLDGCLEMARRTFSAESKYESLTNFLDFCDANLPSSR